MAELQRHGGATVQLERSGTVLAEHAPPAPPTKMDYPNERASIAVFRKRIVELVTADWHLRRGDPDLGSPVARDPRIEAELRDTMDPDRLDVYRDWLIERGDPCGELAALRARGDTGGPIAELEARYDHALYGMFVTLVGSLPDQQDAVTFAWRHGWIEGIEVEGLRMPTLVAFALHAPMARFVRRLVVKRDCTLGNLRYALVNTERRTMFRELDTAVPDAAAQIADGLPALETITMPAGEAMSHATARTLTLLVDRGTTTLVGGSWPALERLTIRAAKRAPPAVVARLIHDAPLERFKSLVHVDVDAELDASAYAKIAERLRGFTA